MEKIKVIIADDHALYLDGLKLLINASDEIEVVAEALNGVELIRLVKQHSPDVVLTDLRMPRIGGIQAIKEIHASGITRILAISTFDSEHLILEAFEVGALGYVLKNAQRGEIIEAIKTVFYDTPYYGPSISMRLMKLISKSKFNPNAKEKLGLFSEKEKEIIRLLCQEKTSEDIGRILFMSKRTVEGFRSRILMKMEVKTLAGVALYAIKNSIYLLNHDDGSTMPSD